MEKSISKEGMLEVILFSLAEVRAALYSKALMLHEHTEKLIQGCLKMPGSYHCKGKHYTVYGFVEQNKRGNILVYCDYTSQQVFGSVSSPFFLFSRQKG